MADPFLPVTEETYRVVLARIMAQLDLGWRVMPIGGSGLVQAGLEAAPQITKDVDLVVMVVTGPAFRVPAFDRTLALARRLGTDVGPRKDQTSIEFRLPLERGNVRVELIRGRNPASGGYFVTRRVLEALARRAGPRVRFWRHRRKAWLSLRRGRPPTRTAWSQLARTPVDSTRRAPLASGPTSVPSGTHFSTKVEHPTRRL